MSEEKRSRVKDLWQLHHPLVVVLAPAGPGCVIPVI